MLHRSGVADLSRFSFVKIAVVASLFILGACESSNEGVFGGLAATTTDATRSPSAETSSTPEASPSPSASTEVGASVTTVSASPSPSPSPTPSATTSASAVATPTFSLSSSSFNVDQFVVMSDTTAGASIYYTLDGSPPSSSSTLYTAAVLIAGSGTTVTLKAIAIKTGSSDSAVATVTASILYDQVAAPTFSVVAGSFSSDQSVSLATTTAGASIYYTVDGTTPTASSSLYASALSVAGPATTKTIKAIAIKSQMLNSAVSSGTYVVNYSQVGTPTVSAAAGTFSSDQSIALSVATAGSTLYYTVDGSTPTASSTPYTVPISVSGSGTSVTIKAIAIKASMVDSAVFSGTYVINYSQVSTPAFSVTAGTFNDDQSVSLTCATAGSSIYYTTDGSTPTASSTPYTVPISVAGNATNTTIKAIATKAAMANSAVLSGAYVIAYDTVATPTFSVAAGTFSSDQSITLSTTTAGASIYYTVDGTAPSAGSTLYAGAIAVAGNATVKTIKALAIKSHLLNSGVLAGTYTIAYSQVGTPTVSTAAGTFSSDQSITLSEATAGATLYYTVDGSTPTASSTPYTVPISVAGHGTSVTIKAIAIKAAMVDSAVFSGIYVITYATVATPAFSVAAGTFNDDQSIGLTCATAGSSIYYTTDGSTPTASSTPYTVPISVAGNATNTTIKAIAVKAAMANSVVASGAYVIAYDTVATPTFSVAAGTFDADQYITLSSVTAGVTLYYTTNGATPTASSTLYTVPVSVIGNGTSSTIKAIAVKSHMLDSGVASGIYTIAYATVAAPTFSATPGTFATDQSITLSSTTAGTTIYYTTDGVTTPTTSSSVYSSAIAVAGNATNTTIKALAVKSGMLNSSVLSGAFTISYATVADPTFSATPGTFTTDQSITLSTTTAGASIYYTLDGSMPTPAKTLYSGAISVANNGTSITIKARAVKSQMLDSGVLTGTFVITYPAAATVTYSPASGSYGAAQSVTLASTTSSATIYYTTDGSTPTTSSAVYSSPISVAEGNAAYITAIAISAATSASTASTGMYSVSCASYAAPPASSLPTGSGTLAAPYLVTTAANLVYINTNATTVTKYYEQRADIDLACISWAPIGTVALKFTGKYDGNGYKVKNLYVSAPATNNQGFFGYVYDGGQVKNVTLINAYVSGLTTVGALVGYIGNSNNYNVAIKNCSVQGGTVIAAGSAGNAYAGGMVGYVANSVIFNSSVTSVNVTATGTDSVGGLVGYSTGIVAQSRSSGTVNGRSYVGGLIGNQAATGVTDRSSSSSTVTSTIATTGGSAGGLVGYLNLGTITRSYATGDVTFSNGTSYGGGLVGNNTGGFIGNSYATGAVSGGTSAGGLVGLNTSSGAIIHSYSTGAATGTTKGGLVGSVSGTAYAVESYWNVTTSALGSDGSTASSSGGLGKSTTNMQTAATFNGSTSKWDTSYIWTLSNSAYPVLKWVANGCSSYTAVAQTAFTTGTGSSADPYQVTTAAELNNVRNYNTSAFKLMNDINMNCLEFDPIGGANGGGFGTGVFDGNGKTISNLTLAPAMYGSGFISGGSGVVRNLKLTNIDVVGKAAGGIAGITGMAFDNYVSGVISGNSGVGGILGNPTTSGFAAGNTVAAVLEGRTGVGGLIGDGGGATTHSSSNSTVIGGINVGGAFGNNSASGGSYVTSFNSANGVVVGGQYVGGFIGKQATKGLITNSYSNGFVEGVDYVGGFVGSNANMPISNSYSVAAVVGTTNVGGFTGALSANQFFNCYWDVTASGQNTDQAAVGTTGKSTAEMQTQSTFVEWDFGNAWSFTTSNYPALRTNGCSSVVGITQAGSFAGGSGTVGAPYQINTPGQFDRIRLNLTKYYILTANLDMSCLDFKPFGDSATYFTGTIDGGGYTISNLAIHGTLTNSPSNVGIIANGNTATIKNLNLTNVDIVGYDYVGAFFGNMLSGSTVLNSTVTGTVAGATTVGGAVGKTQGTITKVAANVIVTSSDTVGGLIGNVVGGTHSMVASKGNVYGIAYYIGGLYGQTSGTTLSNCYASGDARTSTLAGVGAYGVGGLIGNALTGTITNCYALGAGVGTTTSCCGFIGAASTATATHSYWSSDSGSLNNTVAGASVTDAWLANSSNLSTTGTWDYVTTPVWKTGSNGFPQLNWEPVF